MAGLLLTYTSKTRFVPTILMKTQAELNALIQEGIERLTYPQSARLLYEPVRYTLATGGKRVRPMLVLIAANLYTEDLSSAVLPALGIEMYHNSTLLHDDVMDKASERRGRPTVHIKWNENQAILSGDAMIGLAYQYISEAPIRALKPILSTFTTMYEEICQGQQYDMDFETRDDVTIDEYMEMIRLKTSVLLGRALQIGAYIGQDKAYGNLSELGVKRYERLDKDIEILYRFGECLGIAFQLQDDWLDCWGDPKTFGKKIGGDILQNKKTFLRITALKNAPEPKTEGMSEAEKIEAYKTYYKKSGAEKACRQAITFYHQEALKALNQVNVPAEKLKLLKDLAAKLENRSV